MYALTVQSRPGTNQAERVARVVGVSAALAAAGADLVGSLESHSSTGKHRHMHGHLVVLTSLSQAQIERLLDDAGGWRCHVEPAYDLDGWIDYCLKSLRKRNVGERVLHAGGIALDVGMHVDAQPLAIAPKAPRSRLPRASVRPVAAPSLAAATSARVALRAAKGSPERTLGHGVTRWVTAQSRQTSPRRLNKT